MEVDSMPVSHWKQQPPALVRELVQPDQQVLPARMARRDQPVLLGRQEPPAQRDLQVRLEQEIQF